MSAFFAKGCVHITNSKQRKHPQDIDRRINAHRKAGRLPFAQLGDPAVEVLHFGLDVYAACDAERREIMARRTMTPHGHNESSGGEYAGSRSDTLFSSDHLHRLSRTAVGVERMDGATHEEEAGPTLTVGSSSQRRTGFVSRTHEG